MASVEIVEVSLSELDSERLWGRHIALPKPNTQTEASAVGIKGWVLGKSAPAVAIELLHDGKVIRRFSLNARCPDVVEAFPNVPGAEESGFRMTLNLLGARPELEVRVQAVLQDQSRVPIGAIRGRRRWREMEDERAGVALVSVVIPCYNQAHFLSEAIESVFAQTYPHFEIVVVDDGSTDDTSEVASRYPEVRLIRQENQGLAGARNTGLHESKGVYLVFLDADDRLLPEALEVGLEHLNDHPECAFVSGHCTLIALDGSPLGIPQQFCVERDHYLALLRGNYIWNPATVIYRRAIFKAVGDFNTSVSPAADYELYFRVAREFPVYCHAKVVAEYRRHDTNMTDNSALMLESVLTVLRSQWEYVKGNKQYEEAYMNGVEHYRDKYGYSPLLEEKHAHWRSKAMTHILAARVESMSSRESEIQDLISDAHDRLSYHQFVKRIMEVARTVFPPEATVVIVGRDDNEVLKLDDRPVWLFPLIAGGGPEKLFAEGKEGSQEAPWIAEGEEYEFKLYAGTETKKLLDSVKVTRSEEDSPEDSPDAVSDQEAQSMSGEAFVMASPNPVPAEEGKLGTTTINWSTGDGSWGQVYVSQKRLNAYYYPADSAEAIAQLEALREKGAEFLVFPKTAMWWLEHYLEFRRHLESHYGVAHREDKCLFFDLREAPADHNRT